MITTHLVSGRTLREYLHCLDCEETFDYYHYDSLADSGHDGHALRALTPDEFREAVHACRDMGCGDQ
jgi:hypothetical protein